MSYLVLARQYRPKTFTEMVGQDHVVRALSNALQSQRLHHAYLFTGTRGVGKTSVARILAKSLNCVGPDGQGGITDEPCGVCQACRDIDAGRFVDYVELDAASNRGVDEISQLLLQSVYKPVVGRFKVFMIDEVHMLSNTAFNAMLKTLEEPPEYLKFVLATTDPQKVPVTVLSRCLQFNLRPMAPETIFEHLQQVLNQEQITFDTGSLRLISRAARGSMRDALSLADQAIAYGNGTIEEAAVRQMLGSVDQSHIYKLIESLAAGDGKAVIELIDFMRMQGLSAAAALEEMTNVLQRMAVLRVVPDAVQSDDQDDAQIAALVPLIGADEVQLLYSIALHGQEELGLASDEYAALVMVLLRVLAFKPFGPKTQGEGTQGGQQSAGGQPLQEIPVQHITQATAQPQVSPAEKVAEAEKKTELTEAAPQEAPPEPVQTFERQEPQKVVQPHQGKQVAQELPPAHATQQNVENEPDDLPPWVSEAIPDDGLQVSQASSSPSQSSAQKEKNFPMPATHAVQTDVAQADTIATTSSLHPAPTQTVLSQPASCLALLEPTLLSKRWEEVARALIQQDLVIAMARELVLNSQIEKISADEQQWEFRCGRQTLISDANRQKVVDALQGYLNHPVHIEFHFADVENTPALRLQAEREEKQVQAEAAVAADPDVQKWLREFPGARIILGSIKAV